MLFLPLIILAAVPGFRVSPSKPATTPPPRATPAPSPAFSPTTPPTLANVPYGPHERQVLDFYQADFHEPTSLLFYIHGGGWVTGDKAGKAGPNVRRYLVAGISVVTINYRYSWQAQLDGVKPPVKAPLEDAARALKFVRSKAREWKIDQGRIAASGASSGGSTALWLALHQDMADPKSRDPVARESTRLYCAGVSVAQTSLDPKQTLAWTPNWRYGGHAFGFMDPRDVKTRDKQFKEFVARRDELLPWIKEYSPIEHASADDPPIYLIYDSPPAFGEEQKDAVHAANQAVKFHERLRALGVDCELAYPGAPEAQHASVDSYLLEKLRK